MKSKKMDEIENRIIYINLNDNFHEMKNVTYCDLNQRGRVCWFMQTPALPLSHTPDSHTMFLLLINYGESHETQLCFSFIHFTERN